MKEISRRNFLKKVAISGAVVGFGQVISYVPLKAIASGTSDMEGIMRNKTEDYWGRRAAIHLLKDNN